LWHIACKVCQRIPVPLEGNDSRPTKAHQPMQSHENTGDESQLERIAPPNVCAATMGNECDNTPKSEWSAAKENPSSMGSLRHSLESRCDQTLIVLAPPNSAVATDIANRPLNAAVLAGAHGS
jgi:hypothetical protein